MVRAQNWLREPTCCEPGTPAASVLRPQVALTRSYVRAEFVACRTKSWELTGSGLRACSPRELTRRRLGDASALREPLEGVPHGHPLGSHDEVNRGAARTTCMAVPPRNAASAREDAHRRGATSLRAVLRIGTRPGGAGSATAVRAKQLVGQANQLDPVQDPVAVETHGTIGTSASMRALVSQKTCSAVPTTCCTTAVRPATFHSARPRASRVSRSDSTPVSPSSSRASGV